jgi:hypothetical protein
MSGERSVAIIERTPITRVGALHHLFWPRVRSGSILLQKSKNKQRRKSG